MNTITDQFKTARLAKNWTQKQLAYFSGMSIEMIRKLEHGQTNPRLNSIEKLAVVLGYVITLERPQADRITK